MFAGGGEMTFVALVNIGVLWAGANTGQYRAGWLDEISGAPTNGIHAQYDPTQSNWQLYHRNNGTNTFLVGGTAVTTGWHVIKIVTNAAATASELFVDGVSQGTLSGNVPTAGFTYGAMLQKSAGTTASTMDVDLFHVWKTFSTARY